MLLYPMKSAMLQQEHHHEHMFTFHTDEGISLTLSFPESVMETLKVALTFESVDEILWCDHSNETSSAVLSHGTIYYFVLNFDFRHSEE